MLEIALDYRQEFHKDVVIDLIGFRRHGHNEGDEPSYTQPLMYRAIEAHPAVATLYARAARPRGRAHGEEVERVEAGQAETQRGSPRPRRRRRTAPAARAAAPPVDGVGRDRRRLPANGSLARIGARAPRLTCRPAFPPESEVCVSSSAAGRRWRRRGPLDWGTAEALAFGSLLLEGTPSGSAARTRAAARSRSATPCCYDTATRKR